MKLVNIAPHPLTYIEPQWRCVAENTDDVLDDCKIVILFKEDVAHLIEFGWLMFNEAYIHGDHMIEDRKDLKYHIPVTIYKQQTKTSYRWRIDHASVEEHNNTTPLKRVNDLNVGDIIARRKGDFEYIVQIMSKPDVIPRRVGGMQCEVEIIGADPNDLKKHGLSKHYTLKFSSGITPCEIKREAVTA